ncbi:MAG: MtsA protein [Sandaracinus sp.]|nr:MtsA protein [Sandaracinus sp.]MCB9635741.1 MtsA protein [Sandaracinus sp.]
MTRRGLALALLVAASCQAPPTARVDGIGPRLVSNRSDRPLLIYGAHLPEGATLHVASVPPLVLPTVRVDEDHRAAVLPEGTRLDDASELHTLVVALRDADGAPLGEAIEITVVDDARHPTAEAITRVGELLAVASPGTDEVFLRPRPLSGAATQPARTLPVGDGPIALAAWNDRLLVLHHDAPELWIVDLAHPATPRVVRVPPHAQDLAVQGNLVWVTSRATDAVHAIDLVTGVERARVPTGPNPRRVAADGRHVLVASLGSNDLTCIDARAATSPEDATPPRRVVADTHTTIVGGHTEAFQPWVMGGKAVRGLVLASDLGVAFFSSVGPNVGPNPQRMEVSMNGGVSVVSLETGRVLRHRSILRGIPEGLAYDARRGLLFAADVATGYVVVLDARALAASDDDARRHGLLGRLAIAPREGTRTIRAASELDGIERAGPELHTGPRRLVLAEDGTLDVLTRLSSELVTLDARRAQDARLPEHRERTDAFLALVGRVALPMTSQPRRRLGEVVFTTDVGLTRMTCDGCHHEGDGDGLLFTKGDPMHVYRSPSLWQARQTPPFFTPALFPSLAFTSSFVLERNRFHDAVPSELEVAALTRFQETVTAPPSPHRRADGGFPRTLTLPDGRRGDPTRGLALFGRFECASCHPGPEHTTDQDPSTRGRLHDVGTPVALPLRAALQDDTPYPLPPPGLVGVHDRFPLLHSGAGGNEVVGDHVEATHSNALRHVLELGRASGRHGTLRQADDTDLADLEAFLRML